MPDMAEQEIVVIQEIDLDVQEIEERVANNSGGGGNGNKNGAGGSGY
jgi:hypothetical protein